LFVCAAAAAFAAVVASRGNAQRSLDQAWPPFALVAGLLAIGVVAGEDGVFVWAGDRIAALRGGDRRLLVYAMLLVACVTALFNLDTAVVFLTPTLVHVARARGVKEEPFLYGTVLMSNSASLLLPGSNLTNLIVLGHHIHGRAFAQRMAPAWAAAVMATLVVVVVMQRTDHHKPREPRTKAPSLRFAEGTVATAIATAIILTSRAPALPVLVLGLATLTVRAVRTRTLRWTDLDPTVIAAVFGIVIAFGTLARTWDAPGRLVACSGPLQSLGISAVTSVAINNLPAAMLLTARHLAHPEALLVGLNIGPNLAVTGSLSAVLWYRAAKSVNAQPSAWTYTRFGVIVAPLASAAALLALFATRVAHR
jgi:arsenical pump membrane protein